MNIVISTEHNQLFRQLYAAADTAISNRHLRGMELYAFRSLTPEELIKEAAGSPADLWLMFFDSDSRSDWPDVLDRLTSFSSQIMVCIVSSDYSTAARLINSHSVRGVAGYIHPVHDNLERSCLNILTYLNRRVTSADGFLIVHGSRCDTRLFLFQHLLYRNCKRNSYVQYTLLRRSIYLPFRHKRIVRKAEAALPPGPGIHHSQSVKCPVL